MNKNLDDFSKTNQNLPKQDGDIFGLLSKYKNCSQSELVNEFINQANIQKQNGTFNKNQISMIANTIMPLLNSEQKRLVNELLEKV